MEEITNIVRLRHPDDVDGHRQLGGWLACGRELSQVGGRDDNVRRSQLRRLPLPG